MKILITGANGMLAKSVINRVKDGNELILTDVADLDITNQEAVMKFVEEKQPEYIINCAAFTAVDKAEEVYELADKINGNGPGNLAKAAKAVNATLIHISTDYVFDGDLDVSKAYVEEDAVGPVTVYGKTKLHGEEQVKNNTDKYYIFRTAWLYGDGNNFVRTMLKLGKWKSFSCFRSTWKPYICRRFSKYYRRSNRKENTIWSIPLNKPRIYNMVWIYSKNI